MWMRRDLRIKDNHALYRALAYAKRVYCVFVFDTDILNALDDKADRRVDFIRESLAEFNHTLRQWGSGLTVLHGRASAESPALAVRLRATAVFANRDYEPAAVSCDAAVSGALAARGIEFVTCKDQVIFDEDEVLTQQGQPFSVFTAYKNAWLKRLTHGDLLGHLSEKRLDHLAPLSPVALPTLESMGFKQTNMKTLGIPTGVTGAAMA